MKDVVAITEHCHHKTVTVNDVSPLQSAEGEEVPDSMAQVIFALRRQGRPIYGFDNTGIKKS
jgi:hypothetical protein